MVIPSNVVRGILSFSFLHAVATYAAPFPCTPSVPLKASPTDARNVHPAHISVVMAMGDSITAGFAAGAGLGPWKLRPGAQLNDVRVTDLPKDSFATPVEQRGSAFSGGKGSDSQVTLPYFLSHFNQSLVGASTSWTPLQWATGGYEFPDKDAMNVALSAAHSWELAAQVAQLKKYSSHFPDFQNRWKLLTIMVGDDDLCDGQQGMPFQACDGHADHAETLVARYEGNLRDALQSLQDSMSRVVIQIVSLFSLKSVHRIRSSHFWCRAVHMGVNECYCLDRTADGSGTVSDQQLTNLDNTVALLNNAIERVTLEFNLKRPDFAVFTAVSVKNQDIPSAPYLSNLDCFHPSAHAHSVLATTLWNNLFDKNRAPSPIKEPVPVYCPTSTDVIHVEPRAPIEVV